MRHRYCLDTSPMGIDRVRGRGFNLFEDSAAARGEKGAAPDEPISMQGKGFADATRGVY